MTEAGAKPQHGGTGMPGPPAKPERLPGAVFLIDSAWRLSWWNAAAAALLNGREAQKETLWTALPVLAEGPLGAALRDAMETRMAAEATGSLPPLEGQFGIAAVPLPDGGLLVLLRKAGQDRATQLEAQLAERTAQLAAATRDLRQARQRMGVLFEHAPLDLAVLSLLPNGDLLLEDCNPVFGQAFGHPHGGTVGLTLTQVFPRRLVEELAAPLARCLADRKRLEFETAVAAPQGRVHARVILVPLPEEQGAPPRVLLTALDVTGIRRAERQLMQAQRMEAIGQLTGGVAHDFNNLLTAIMGSLELLGHRATDPRTVRYLETANSAARRGAALTQQLLAYARRQDLTPQALDVNAAIASTEDMLRRSLGGLVLVEIAPAQGLWPASADPTQLELVVLNLAINARDAMKLGGTVRIETRNVPAAEAPAELEPGDFVCITVRDTGHGMPPEVLARAFEPFFTTKGIGKGSGLGLAQAYGFARQLGGIVRIDSAVDAGTTVEVFLPRAAATAPRAAEQATPMRVVGPGCGALLLVDDDDEVRSVAATLLREAGYMVSDHSNGAAALAALERGTEVDAMLVDVAMPGMTGIELVDLVRQRWPTVPIVFLTGNSDPEVAGHLDGYVLNKPFALSDLLQAVEQATMKGSAPAAGHGRAGGG